MEHADRATVVTVSGEVDLFGAPALASALDRAAEIGAPMVVVDLEDCTFFDSNGLYALLKAERSGRKVVLCHPPDGCAARLLEVTVPGHFATLPSRGDALRALAV